VIAITCVFHRTWSLSDLIAKSRFRFFFNFGKKSRFSISNMDIVHHYMWSSWCYCHPIISCFSKIQNGLPFWCQLTKVVLEKRLLNVCVCVCVLAPANTNTSHHPNVLITNSVSHLIVYWTSPPQSHLGRACRSGTTTQQSPHWLQWDIPKSPRKEPFSFDDHYPDLIHPSLDWPNSPS